jgi:hypothetical protein
VIWRIFLNKIKTPLDKGVFVFLCELLFPLFFVVLLWLIYTLYLIPNGNFDAVFPPIISFVKFFVAESVAKSPSEWCRVVVGL